MLNTKLTCVYLCEQASKLTNKQPKRQAGFTLVELLVVIAIIAMLMIIAIVNFRGAEEASNLRNEAENVAGVIREAKNYAVSQKRIEDPDNPGTTFVPTEGYGAYFSKNNPTEYIIFADTGASSSNYFDSADDIIVEQGQMLPDVALDRITYNNGVSEANEDTSLVFVPPDGQARFNIDAASLLVGDVSLVLEGISGSTRTVTAYAATGAVEIE
ncbi:Tfp pilus assembly protein FimT/FimU [Patescibacteria group bacterium]